MILTKKRKNNDFFSYIVFKGKTRTKDKYRIVYSDFQRRELEKEFNLCTKYITIKRKSELSSALKLSERQVSKQILLI